VTDDAESEIEMPPRDDGASRPGLGDAKSTTWPPSDRPFGSDAAAILAMEHYSLLGTRALIWNEAMSRATVFLTVLSASIIALALMADATGFGSHTTTVALVLLPVVLLLGIATYVRLVQINIEEFKIVLAMNPASARLPEDRTWPGAVLHHRPPRRRARLGDDLHA
jgi:hypothetical protein